MFHATIRGECNSRSEPRAKVRRVCLRRWKEAARAGLILWACLCSPSAPKALGASPLGTARAQAGDDVVAEFRRYFRKYTDSATRVEAVLALEGVDSQGMVTALLPVLTDKDQSVAGAAVQVLAGIKADAPVALLVERLSKEKKGARLDGLLAVVARGRWPAAAEASAKHLAAHAWQTRRLSVEALAAIGAQGADTLLLPACSDREIAVRCAALEGLATLHSKLALVPARRDLENESWQVRTCAIHALGAVRDVDSIEPLIERMEKEDGRLVEDAAEALKDLTGQGFGLRTKLWRRFWETWKERYELPTREQLAKKEKARAKSEAQYQGRASDTAFAGLQTPSRSILFVVDVSGSMDDKVVDVQRFKKAGHTKFRRIDIVKTELTRTIEQLESYVKFNILTFATDTDRWKKKLVKANVLNKSSAVDWISKLEPIGGTSKQDLHEVGLFAAANLEGGKTNTYLALMTALGALPAGRRRADYRVDVDTIFFLSDGLPSMGEFVEVEDLLAAVRKENALRKIRLHTIGIGSFQKSFLRRLAAENGGRFVDLGK